MTDPDSYKDFQSPSEIVDDINLTLSQKCDLFEKWKLDEEALVRGANEGLQSGKENKLKSVQNALLKLEAKYLKEYKQLSTALSQAEFKTMAQQAGAALGTRKT